LLDLRIELAPFPTNGDYSRIGGLVNSMFDWQPLRTADVILAIAALLGPILAVQAQKWIEQWRAAKDRRVVIYRTLMATRAIRLGPRHVEALNAIPLDFYGYKSVMDGWEEYFAQLHREGPSQDIWNTENQRLFIVLVTEIGRTIGFTFNAAEVERAYFPKGHHAIQNDQQVVQYFLARWLAGEHAVKMEVTGFPSPDEEMAAKQEELRAAAVDWLKATPTESNEAEEQPKARKFSPR
jgi:hypothetical protein